MRSKLSKFAFVAGFLLAMAFTPVVVFAQNEQNQQYQYPPPQYQYPPQRQYQYPPPQYQYPQGQYQYPPPQYPYPQQQYSIEQEDAEQEDLDQDITFRRSASRWNNQASRDKSIGVSIGYQRTVFDALKDYPFVGFGISVGTDLFISLNDATKIGSGISIYYFTASAEDGKYDAELTLSGFALGLFPTIRFGQGKTYADVSFGMSIPISSDVTLEVPGYETQTLKIKNTEADFQLSLSGRFDVIGLDISKVLTGSDKPIGLSTSTFISIGDTVEVVPHISYFIGEVFNKLTLAIGFNRFF